MRRLVASVDRRARETGDRRELGDGLGDAPRLGGVGDAVDEAGEGHGEVEAGRVLRRRGAGKVERKEERRRKNVFFRR